MQQKKRGSLYIGYSNDIDRRVKEHRKKFPDAELLYYEAYKYSHTARTREKRLKYYGSAWRALKQRILA